MATQTRISKTPWRIFFLRAAVVAAWLRGAWTAIIVLAVGAVSSGLVVVLLLDRIVRACERAARIEDWRDALLGWWGRAFTWPAPPRGWRVRTGDAPDYVRLEKQDVLRAVELPREVQMYIARARFVR